MANSYWTFLAKITRFTLGRAEAMNALFAGIEAGFDKIPDIGEFINNSGDYAAATGTGAPYVITLKPESITAYAAGLRLRFKANVASPSGGASLNLNGIGVKAIVSSSGAALPAGVIPSGSIVDVSYDGTAFRLAVASPSATAYAPLAGATFTGPVKVPTASTAADSLDAANVTMLRAAIAGLVSSSPAALDTLAELAAALGNDASFATTMTNALSAKVATASLKADGTPNAPMKYDALGGLIAQYLTIRKAGAETKLNFDVDTGQAGGIYLSLAGTLKWMLGVSGDIFWVYNYAAGNSAFWCGADNVVDFALMPTVAGTPLPDLITPAAGSLVPVGAVMGFDLDAPPTGWIVGDGSAISRTTYAALDAKMYVGDANNATATAWYRCTNPSSPSTSRSTTGAYIVTRDLRGVFPRFLDGGKGYDTGRVRGSYQGDTVGSHTHSYTAPQNTSGTGNIAAGTTFPFASVATGAAGTTETRPKNVALLGCIKY